MDSTEVARGRDDTTTVIINNKWASHVARHPWYHFGVSLCLTLVLSGIAVSTGDLLSSIDTSFKGWLSRGTPMAAQQSQVHLVQSNTGGRLSTDEGWQELMDNVQPSWQSSFDVYRRRRQLVEDEEETNVLECDLNWYAQGKFLQSTPALWPVWQTKDATVSVLDPPVLRDICQAEANTQHVLESRGLCGGCPTGCLPPLSIVSFVRIQVADVTSTSLSCTDLAAAWEPIRSTTERQLVQCVQDLRVNATETTTTLPDSCPLGFAPHMMDDTFGTTMMMNDKETAIITVLRTTSSVFATAYNGGAVQKSDLYALSQYYDRADNGGSTSGLVRGAYDTPRGDFNGIAFGRALWQAIALAFLAGTVSAAAMVIHTRSLWLALAGLLQIFLSFPLAYFVYRIVFGISFFPFMNFLGVYVVLGLGADDVFVAVDKWKNARIAHPFASREKIASLALPDAARAMFLTTLTTAVAFWSTAICPIAPLKVFAIFLGLIVIFDYILCVLLVFPAICLFDKWREAGNQHWLVEFQSRHSANNNLEGHDGGSCAQEVVNAPSFITRALSQYYETLHKFRRGVLIIFLVWFGCSIYFAAQLQLPSTSAVRQLPEYHETEMSYRWRLRLLDRQLLELVGGQVQILWGVKAADTGNHLDPNSGTQLVLDESFDPRPIENQQFLQTFCRELLQQPFVNIYASNFKCPFDSFQDWLLLRSNSGADEVIAQECPKDAEFPVSPLTFDVCVQEFVNSDSGKAASNFIYMHKGKVQIVRIPYRHIGIRFNSGYKLLDQAWKAFDRFMTSQLATAPNGVDNAFGSNFDFWWYETNGLLFNTAFGGTAIALSTAFVVLLVSSRSFRITLFAVITIAQILLSVTMLLALSGWSLGFLEAICFAILVGMSCDFVLHFGHAYCSLPGTVDRHQRTKHALTNMGPSIIAAAVTTMAAAFVLLFARVVFFRRFGLILLYTFAVATIGSGVLFFALADSFGPAEPTKCIDSILKSFRTEKQDLNGSHETEQSEQSDKNNGEIQLSNAERITKDSDELVLI